MTPAQAVVRHKKADWEDIVGRSAGQYCATSMHRGESYVYSTYCFRCSIGDDSLTAIYLFRLHDGTLVENQRTVTDNLRRDIDNIFVWTRCVRKSRSTVRNTLRNTIQYCLDRRVNTDSERCLVVSE
jgi:hypothetical protein